MIHLLVIFAALTISPFLAAEEEEPSELYFEGERIKSPQEIQQNIENIETLFKRAQDMFDPWYAGPLATGGAYMMPPGKANFQPYLYVTENYAAWNSDRKLVHTPHRTIVNPYASLQFGLAKWLDMNVALQGFINYQQGKRDGGYGDMSVALGFPILVEGLHQPALKFVFGEIFPTGKYQRLSPRKLGLDSTGGGSFQSQFGLRISKIFLWLPKHPINIRASYTYGVPAKVKVRGFNSYGGGFGTAGTVNPGNFQQADAAAEYSFTQNWVLAFDVVYFWANKTPFHGTRGTTSSGAPAKVGFGSTDQLSFAPSLEYNPRPTLNFIAGVWFDVYGRNTPKYFSGILSVSYGFKVNKVR